MGRLLNVYVKNKIKPLYDIEIKDNNNFVVNDGIVVHNSEQYLEDQGLCNLASIFCSEYYDKNNKINYELLEKSAISINRFLDNVIEMELRDRRFATKEQEMSLISLRREGAGLTDIAGLLFLNGLEYGTKDGNAFMENFQDKYNYYLYKASIALGKERGSFWAFNKEKYLKSGFIKQLVKRHPDLTFDYMRNVCVSSIAPTGSNSLMARYCVLSYGIENSFGMYFWKRTRITGSYQYYFVVPRVVRDELAKNNIKLPMKSDTIKDNWNGDKGREIAKIIDENKHLLKFKSASETNYLDKLDLMSKIQKNVDSSISVTYELPETSTWKDVYNLILEAHRKEVKSIAGFPIRKMYGIVTKTPFKELAFNLVKDGVYIHPDNFSNEELSELSFSRETVVENNADSPKRLKKLQADVYVVSVKGVKYCMIVGLQNNVPYEFFGGLLDGLNFDFTYKRGIITKEGKGKYSLEVNGIIISDFAKRFESVEQLLFRMVSTMLRHGINIKFIVEQLQKATEDMFSLSSAASRILKKYIKDGEKVTGQVCPSCGGRNLIYEEGCVTCAECSWSKCQ